MNKCIDCKKEIDKRNRSKRCYSCANKKSNILLMTWRNHTKLHIKAYEYLIKIGKIKSYITWFNKHYLK